MLLAISDQTVALVGVVSGAVLGLAGTLGVIFNTWFAKRAEQKARVLEGRSKAYERLLWYARRTMLDAERTYPLEEPAWGEPLGLLPDPEYLEISAAVAAFGTVSVLQAFEEFNAKVRYFFARADELKKIEQKGGPMVDRSELEGVREEARKLMERLDELARAELEQRKPKL